MIEALKSDDIVDKVGGRSLTALIQRRLKEIVVDGARPLIEREGRTDLELVVEEIRQASLNRISARPSTNRPPPDRGRPSLI